ncbi:N-acetylglucosamine kinase [Spirosoma rhododendri]|uniref:N-acetylglucosamine kinase n=1 Tax=Spirosoma rhododendri TaxID=2728024 RepID=A0A7L5DJK5_9BACT|nr:N-acetylglucosamine kinase [Spirosoma rhododendri]QJD78576.1 N-acetylglucosamine kinase [Spirosoma rhododendri]
MLLIADSGSTKTDWRWIASNGTVAACQTDGINPYYQTTDQIRNTLANQLLPNLPADAITSVFFYGAGCSGPSVNGLVEQALWSVLPGAESVNVASDMLGAARAAARHSAGIVCILGTGANACCYDGAQITRGIQSLGFWLGDEGSGGYLGKTLVRAVFQRTLPADLIDLFQNRYQLDRPTLLDNAYKKPNPNRYFASFTPFLGEHQHHPAVQTLVTDAFRLFLQTYIQPFPESIEWPIHFVGSVTYYFQPLLKQAVEQAGLTMGCVLKAPIDQLVQYHQTTN